jgi:hypothetical protein
VRRLAHYLNFFQFEANWLPKNRPTFRSKRGKQEVIATLLFRLTISTRFFFKTFSKCPTALKGSKNKAVSTVGKVVS